MNCQKCNSRRIATITAKCSDTCFTNIVSEGYSKSGYAPCIPHVTGPDEDYVEFSVCLDCGQMQGEFPVPSPRSS